MGLKEVAEAAFEKQTKEAAQRATDTKYHAQGVEVDGIFFQSKWEASRYRTLKTLEGAGLVRNLRWQVPLPVFIRGIKVCDYIADFVYDERVGPALTVTTINAGECAIAYNWLFCIEDAKGVRTAVYLLKKKMIEATYGIEVRESRRKPR